MAQNGALVDTEGMRKAGQLFEGASTEASNQMRQVNQLMLSLQQSWRGEASMKFNKAMNDWENQFSIIIKELNSMIEKMGGNAKHYDTQEADAVSLAPNFGGEGLQGL